MGFFASLMRTRTLGPDTELSGPTEGLQRCLTTTDLLFLGVGSIFGQGVYVVAGELVKSYAGPAAIISFLIAGGIAILSGLCYAELGTLVPLSGSGYSYVFVTVGELPAFIIGWNMLLEYVIGAASVLKSATIYCDTMLSNKISEWLQIQLPIHILQEVLSSYFDLSAFVLAIILTVLLILGVSESLGVNFCVTTIDILIFIPIVVIAIVNGTLSNWNLQYYYAANEDPKINNTVELSQCGSGGFFPYGWSGVISGAATAFYGYASFECIATTGEETLEPNKSIPRSLLLTIIICMVCYCSVAAALSLVAPYCSISADLAIIYLFKTLGDDWNFTVYIIGITATFALLCSAFGCKFAMVRIAYAMGKDGLLFKVFALVSDTFKTPWFSALFFGTLVAICAALITLEELVKMMSIGTLAAYTMVAFSVIIIRYREKDFDFHRLQAQGTYLDLDVIYLPASEDDALAPKTSLFDDCFKTTAAQPSTKSYTIVGWSLFIAIVATIIGELLVYKDFNWIASIVGACVSTLIVILCLVIINNQPQWKSGESFRTPFVPLVPYLAIACNLRLMMSLTTATWIRFISWVSVGLIIYFGYGRTHSREAPRTDAKQQSDETTDLTRPEQDDPTTEIIDN